METVYIGLGSNLGDARQNVERAMASLVLLSEEAPARSSVWRSQAVGLTDDGGDFANSVLSLTTQLSPLELLDAAQTIEEEFGRPRDHERCVSRSLDIDILLFGDTVFEHERLVIPHPRAHERLFVLLPLRELTCDIKWRGRTIDEWIVNASPMQIERWDE